MPCTCTGYGDPLPRLPINTGEEELKGGQNFGEGGENRKQLGEFVFERSEARAKQKIKGREGGKKRGAEQ